MEDPILLTEVLLPSLVEAQYTAGGAWTVGAGGLDTLEMERSNNFALYDVHSTA
jgi:hypothetical protein